MHAPSPPRRAGPAAPVASLLRLSAAVRLVIAAAMSGVLWLAVLWAMA